uniref:DUF4780 domain-containing protein n=1 Tax=Zeugodacus cucurbitae TaxID=28588 RepID=A0A0A1X3U0_ZEUCU
MSYNENKNTEKNSETMSNNNNDNNNNSVMPSTIGDTIDSSITDKSVEDVSMQNDGNGANTTISSEVSKMNRNRRDRHNPLPTASRPDSLSDRRRVGMSGATVKWYLRHLLEGKSAKDARELAINRTRESSASERQQDLKSALVSEQTSSVIAVAARDGGCGSTSQDKTSQAEKRRSGEITSHELPGKMQKQCLLQQSTQSVGVQKYVPELTQVGDDQLHQNPTRRNYVSKPTQAGGEQLHPQSTQLKSAENSVPKTTHVGEEQLHQQSMHLKNRENSVPKPTQAGIRIAVVPLNYPAEAMRWEKLTALQNRIIREVAKGWRHPLSFYGVYFKAGLLLIDCRDEETATWLTEVAPKLEGWKSPTLCTKRGEEIPQIHYMSVYLPRSADNGVDFALKLLKAQNEVIKTSAWRIINSGIEDTALKLNIGIDDESYKYIRKQRYRLNYRFSAISMRTWKSKAAEEKEEASEPITNYTDHHDSPSYQHRTL